MKLGKFYEQLNHINASRENTLKYAHLVLNDMRLFPELLDILL